MHLLPHAGLLEGGAGLDFGFPQREFCSFTAAIRFPNPRPPSAATYKTLPALTFWPNQPYPAAT